VDLKSKLETLQTELDCNIKFFCNKHKKTKQRAYSLKISSVIFSAMITVLLGISSNQFMAEMMKNLAIVLGAVVTIISAVDAFYNYGGLWVKNAVTLAKLRELKREVDFYAAGCSAEDISENKLNRYMNELQRIFKDDIKQWLRIRERITAADQNKDNQSLMDIRVRSREDLDLEKFRQDKQIEKPKE
jgi:hypothetical protein